MRLTVLISITLLLFILPAFKTAAQDCSALYAKGTMWEFTTYDAKNNIVAVTTNIIGDISNEASRKVISYQYSTLNKKGKEADKGYRSLIFANNNVLVNLETIIPQYKSDDANYFYYICSAKPGDVIPDFDKMTTYTTDNMGTKSIATNKVHISDAKYNAYENITTTLGTFNCIKLNYTIRIDLVEYNFTDWLDENARVIKREIRNKKNEIESTAMLTKFNQ